jgi:PhnB protein
MRVNAYLTFDGRCEEAFRLYERCMGARVTYLDTYGNSPLANQVAPKVAHATLMIGGDMVQGVDVEPAGYRKPQGVSLTLSPDDVAQADAIFAALAENGAVQVPIAETYWAKRFGMVTDRFGIQWMINCGEGA